MKIRTIPQEYEAMQFNGLTDEVELFIADAGATINKQGDSFVLSNYLGNLGLNIGDCLYKHNQPLTIVSIAHNDNLFDKYFEVINNEDG